MILQRFSEMNFQIIFAMILLNQMITANDKLLDAQRNLRTVITKYNILTPWEKKFSEYCTIEGKNVEIPI